MQRRHLSRSDKTVATSYTQKLLWGPRAQLRRTVSAYHPEQPKQTHGLRNGTDTPKRVAQRDEDDVERKAMRRPGLQVSLCDGVAFTHPTLRSFLHDEHTPALT